MNNIIVIYHGQCADGFGAAWAARRYFGETADYYAATHQDPPPDVTDKHVVLVDFSYKRPVLQAMAASARSIKIFRIDWSLDYSNRSHRAIRQNIYVKKLRRAAQ